MLVLARARETKEDTVSKTKGNKAGVKVMRTFLTMMFLSNQVIKIVAAARANKNFLLRSKKSAVIGKKKMGSRKARVVKFQRMMLSANFLI